MSAISNNNIARAIYLELGGKDEGEQSLIFPKIIQFLVKKRLLARAPDILNHLSKIINDEEKRIVARVSSKDNLDEKTKHELKHSLAKRYLVEEVDLVLNTDEKLLGGLKIEVNDEVIDLTIKNKIGKLQEYLIQTT
ncbi:MAG: ATP synthase subunit delta [Candidatus Nomurabacteria bacterium GW2011_GWB1_40_7]|uniref:ATP synthase subunit delta n=1 Tax=Candidatus Nomurabacteria bacterium GW2011_GWB1_40_7 TaxID=1618744 RepID=A0A0G0T0Q0_9BACT|nr:MAG: ATP synthase subunit delta [Candidatus Nomurabacteria bacterium GW2011_GWB1_40_7]